MAYQFTQTGAEIQDILDLARNDIAAEYDPTASYVVGDYCTYEDSMYRCTGATTGAFAPAKWSAVTAGDEISALNATFTSFTNLFSAAPTAVSAYQSRASNISGGFYKIGRLVIVCVQFTSNGGNFMAYLSGFPKPCTTNAFAPMQATTSGYTPNLHAVVLTDGTMGVSAHTNGDIIGVSGAYIAVS